MRWLYCGDVVNVDAACAIADALAVNTAVTWLRLDDVQDTAGRAAPYLSAALKANATLQSRGSQCVCRTESNMRPPPKGDRNGPKSIFWLSSRRHF